MSFVVLHIYPYVFRSIQHSVDEKELLGDRTLVEYVAERLAFDTITTKYVLDKHPQIYNVRVTKVIAQTRVHPSNSRRTF